jgi:GDP-4-dehydro-6-deoxy-D-mannose reductase
MTQPNNSLFSKDKLKIVVTGATGFVARYAIRAIRNVFSTRVDLLLTARKSSIDSELGEIISVDVMNRIEVDEVISKMQPHCILHLAGISGIPAAASAAELSWRVHVDGTLNLARSILKYSPKAQLVYVGSGQVYGSSAIGRGVVDENCLLSPIDDYSVTKAAADLALGALVNRGLRCVRFRPFNHTGPMQSTNFSVPSFANQIARIENGLEEPILRVGNLDAERDFLDVRDVVQAYLLAMLNADVIEPGCIFNVSSGIGVKMNDVLLYLINQSNVKIDVQIDSTRVRPIEIPTLVGDSSKISAALGWKPIFDFKETLHDIMNFHRSLYTG